MRRRDFLKGLAAVCGVVALPVTAAIPWSSWSEHTKPKPESFDFSWHTTITSKRDFAAAVQHLYSHCEPREKARLLQELVALKLA